MKSTFIKREEKNFPDFYVRIRKLPNGYFFSNIKTYHCFIYFFLEKFIRKRRNTKRIYFILFM